ncbi:MAG: hypothetical protein ABJA32_01910 [Ginsengibacter sp.]
MAADSNDKTISSTDSGFPPYLNFDTLRSEAIAYLGNLTGKIWTDYNVHDPGITILEVLAYAVLDLGYRTNLPTVDLLTRRPGDTSVDNNFLTPAQILTNNPLTITDFRKLLIDISGVKNAWLEIADQLPVNPCEKANTIPGAVNLSKSGPCDCDHLNGLYHVFIELEKDYDLTNPTDADEYNDIINSIKCALMAHRNLCEDFIDIKILCKLKIGLCADIELEPDAMAEDVYLTILEALRDLFSPSPKFYTLPQLLAKGKSIEEIFAGRPYDVKESYGFVDTDEFEEITLRKKIHLSDVYHILFDIDGVKNVRNLAWKLCNNETPQPLITNQWELQIPENFIPEFDVTCSGFQLFKYGLKVKLDTSKANAVFAMNFSAHGKILYQQKSPYLDTIIPGGIYRSDLADYSSIQNDFPHVYGIKKGDLSPTASNPRKAQALQLQGFLLFFDQLLANYLSQLANIRSLFAFSSTASESDQHTYFTNTLTDVPQLEKLLRFNANSDNGDALGSEGSILAYPTGRKNLEDLIASGRIQNTDLDRRCNDANKDDFPPYQFCYDTTREQAEDQLRDDLLNGDYDPVVIANYNGCYFFYCFTSSTNFALISKKYYASEREAQTAAASIKYLGTFAENYRSFIIDDNPSNQYFSFDLELNLNAYSNYLQLIAENESLYMDRRQGFLNHLLSRFAEQFTDFALLNSEFLTPAQLQKGQIKSEEKFLSNYSDLSSNRGKAYNYKCDGWENDNISGFEKRVKALSGIENWKKHYLCNFVVEKADEIYQLSISLFGSAFMVNNKMFTYEAGYSSLSSLYKKLGDNPSMETEYLDHEQKWSVYVKDEFGNKYSDQNLYDSKEAAQAYINSVHSVLIDKPDVNANIFISKYIYRVLFKSGAGQVIEESKTKFDATEDAQKYFNKISSKISNFLNDSNEFVKVKKGIKPEKLILIKNENYDALYIDRNKFEFKPVDVIQLGSVKKKFALLNDQKTIQFDSLIDYDTVKLADSGFQELLGLLAYAANYTTQQNGDAAFNIKINDGKSDVAAYFESFKTQEDAQKKVKEILSDVIAQTYHLSVSDPVPDNWEFQYQLTNPAGGNIEFKTQSAFTTEIQAQAAAKQFYSHIPSLKIDNVKNDTQLILDHKKPIIAHAELATATASAVGELLQQHQQLFSAVNNPDKKFIDASLSAGKINDDNPYIYKLVDKDHLLAKSNYVFSDIKDALAQKNNLINAIQAGYDFTKISFGVDVIDARKDAVTNVTWYHYMIKCSNVLYQKGTLLGQPLILFESVKGYASSDEAMQAFLDNYLLILRKAFIDTNYGAGQFISLTEILVHEADECTKIESTVYVRPETLYEFDGNVTPTTNELILLAKSYPILYISNGRYRFSLFNKNMGQFDWRSMSSYSTPQEAMQRFQFFLSLLNYSGNIYIEHSDTDCRYRIYIREVLALSMISFNSTEDAWGVNGIEKFICVAQSDDGFHTYLNRTNCTNSFFVACGNTGLIHPCKYDTPERRDNVINSLYKAASFNFFDLLQTDEKNNISLLGLNKKPVANFFIERNNNQTNPCELLIQIFEAIYIDSNFVKSDKNFYLLDGNKNKIASPVSADITFDDWKQKLRAISCHFPLFRKEASTATANTLRNQQSCDFYIRIKLPGFNNCVDDLANDCPDLSSDDDCKPGCYIAWQSDCCFSSCCEALLFYLSALKLIGNFTNYKPVYECDCGQYGIELHTDGSQIQEVNNDANISATFAQWLCRDTINAAGNFVNNQTFVANKCTSEIVAINPQSYASSGIACDAAVRARELINSEGLHLVEHILLRPQCADDCNCDYLPKPCVISQNVENHNKICHFEWVPGSQPDPCATGKTICFTPGCDPYSFIATIALPAWPQRFRSAENKAVVENLLQKEAPAHVLLRIIWMNPRDFCCFEFYFKKWNYWLAKKMCDPFYNNCDFLGLLFHKDFQTLADCNECVPCACNQDQPVSCFDDQPKDSCTGVTLISQLNALYCWDNNNYDTYNCENLPNFQNPIPILKKQVKSSPIAAQSKTSNDTSPQKTIPKTQSTDASTTIPLDDREKYLLIQSRYSKYTDTVQKTVADKPGNKIAEDALRFLSDTAPTPERYEELVNKILKNKPDKTKKIPGLNVKEKNTLIDNISWQYFDRICINKGNAADIISVGATFNHLRKNKINMQLLYDDWNGKELQTIDPAINLNQIKKVVI